MAASLFLQMIPKLMRAEQPLYRPHVMFGLSYSRCCWRWVFAVAMAAGGCSSQTSPSAQLAKADISTTQPATPGLTPLHAFPQGDAYIDPPVGWRQDKMDVDANHTHAVWLSPTGDTAYGVVLMYLPLPVGPDMVLWGFLNHLRATDKEANVLRKEKAADLPGLRFVAESGSYLIRVNLTVHSWKAWAIYAGTLRAKGVNPPELKLAEEARDNTRVGLPAQSASK